MCRVVDDEVRDTNLMPITGTRLPVPNMRSNPKPQQYYRSSVYSKGVIGGGQCCQRRGDSTNWCRRRPIV